MSFFTVSLATAVIAALKSANICDGRVYSFVPIDAEKPYIWFGDLSAKNEAASQTLIVDEQFSIKIFDDAVSLKLSLEIRQQISEILLGKNIEVAGAGLVLITSIAETSSFGRDGQGNETFERFNALLNKE